MKKHYRIIERGYFTFYLQYRLFGLWFDRSELPFCGKEAAQMYEDQGLTVEEHPRYDGSMAWYIT